MKKYISILFVFGFLFFFQSCSSQTGVDSKTVEAWVNSQEFTFYAQRANPTNYDVINTINSMPNATSSRVLNLDNGSYTLELKNNVLEVVLPYFGRSYKANYSGDNSYRFTSKDYTINKTRNKKGNWIVKIQPNDVNNVREIIIEVFKNGKALVSMTSNDRQPISYDGYISKTSP
ncbi:DUF4251 domain-containing protein [uncultured Chryseobacterium sp.]|jgi:hypothetical protein|uniref:DUF4251 domain-containing protein n=1 Tax=uncultured Chryseobacterium sp. TaxID=259322 RepID=UPI002614092C|nr:DUF4251 domain-containing protein [uncultured Chryseobacterium sp.]